LGYDYLTAVPARLLCPPLRCLQAMPGIVQAAMDKVAAVTGRQYRLFDYVGHPEAELDRVPANGPRGSDPAELFLVDGGPAKVGVIASVTRPFCGDCDRVRLTADGQVRNCLFAREESDLRGALRAGATDEEIADRWVAAMATKRAGHGIDDPLFLQPDRPMSAIGG